MVNTTPVALLSRQERALRIERAVVGLYRWYTEKSQTQRRWTVDGSFDWRNIRTDHHPDVLKVIEGFFAVEQYVPDYTREGLNLLRRSFGRSQFQLRWGAEEAKHADLWRNTLLFAARRTPDELDEYTEALRENAWELPFEDPMKIIFYTVFQELATKLNYTNLQNLVKGKGNVENPTIHIDPVLEKVAQTIATDEAAHYAFYLEIGRVMFYYMPAESLEALWDVLTNFAMPAQAIIPNWTAEIQDKIINLGLYNGRTFYNDVLQVALGNLSIENRLAVRKGIQRVRQVPTEDGEMRDTIAAEVLDVPQLTESVRRAYGRVQDHEAKVGLDLVDSTVLTPGPLHAFIVGAGDAALR